jgi:hypothetical protein
MKPRTIILSLALIATVPFVVGEERLGDLNRDSIVLTPGDDINNPSVTTKDGFPVFEITVPEGYVEVQVRASLTNFEPGFLLKAGATYLYNYIPTGATVAGRKVYRALGTTHEAKWSVASNRWEIQYSDTLLLVSDNQALAPWDIPSGEITAIILPGAEVTPQPPPPGYFAFQKEYFIYRFCTTGAPADAEWGQGSGDPDAWVFIANQSATPGDNTEFKRQKWDQNSSLTSDTPSYSNRAAETSVPSNGCNRTTTSSSGSIRSNRLPENPSTRTAPMSGTPCTRRNGAKIGSLSPHN